jgi:hypothetical protein
MFFHVAHVSVRSQASTALYACFHSISQPVSLRNAKVGLVILGLVQSALQSIFQAAVFLYARDGQVPEGFEVELLGNAMIAK